MSKGPSSWQEKMLQVGGKAGPHTGVEGKGTSTGLCQAARQTYLEGESIPGAGVGTRGPTLTALDKTGAAVPLGKQNTGLRWRRAGSWKSQLVSAPKAGAPAEGPGSPQRAQGGAQGERRREEVLSRRGCPRGWAWRAWAPQAHRGCMLASEESLHDPGSQVATGPG